MSINAHMLELWPHLPHFMALARAQNLVQAGESLSTDRTTVRRRIDHLEKTLGGRLFDRREGKFHLTPLGRKMLALAETVEQDFTDILVLGSSPQFRPPPGTLKISSAGHIVDSFATLITAFSKQYAGVRIELIESNHFADLHDGSADIALRISKEKPPLPLQCTSLGTISTALYGKAGRSLDQQQYIGVIGESEVPDRVKSYMPSATLIMCVDGVLAHRELIANGAGAGILPCICGDRDERIQKVSRDFPGFGRHIWLVTHNNIRNSPRVRAFFDFAQDNSHLI